jgi:hypothetical protein
MLFAVRLREMTAPVPTGVAVTVGSDLEGVVVVAGAVGGTVAVESV